MKNALPEAIESIAAAERSLRGLMQASVEAGNYEEVTVLARWAEQLASIANDGAISLRSAQPTLQSAVSRSRPSIRGDRTVNSIRGAKSPKTIYPVFQRAGDQLVKIGWSKMAKAEYEHRAPKKTAVGLLMKMQRLSGDRELVSMADALPLRLPDQDVDVPPYQVYLCLAWLRTIGIVTQHGRQGYSLVSKVGDATTEIDAAWQVLPRYRR